MLRSTGSVFSAGHDLAEVSGSSPTELASLFALEDGRGEEVGPSYQRALRERFFVGEANIALHSVQLELAEELALPRGQIERRLDDGSALAAVCEDHAEKERLRIQGSPTYMFDGGRAMLYGNFDYGILRSTVEALVRGVGLGGSAC